MSQENNKESQTSRLNPENWSTDLESISARSHKVSFADLYDG